jgi:hypothetical protein
MQGVDLQIRLHRASDTYRPGDVVHGEVEVRTDRPVACERLVVRRLWRARGKGNPEEGRPTSHDLFHGEWSPGPIHCHPFEFTLPNGPATYRGHLLHVGCYIEARAEVALAIDPRAEVELPLEAGPSEGYFFGPTGAPAAGSATEGGDDDEVLKLVLGGVLSLMGLASLLAWAAAGLAGWPEALGAAMFLSLGGTLALPVVRRKAAEWKLGSPRVRIDGAAAHPGGHVDVRVTVSPRVPVTLDGLRADLVAREEVVRGTDSDRATERREVHRTTVSPERARRAIEAGDSFTIEERIPVPPGAPLTFAGRENRLEWLVEVAVAISGWPDWIGRFPVTVGPPAALAAAGILDAPADLALQASP